MQLLSLYISAILYLYMGHIKFEADWRYFCRLQYYFGIIQICMDPQIPPEALSLHFRIAVVIAGFFI
ncbi:MAG: hypothetical protein JL50_13325 [Peptococcaceae bacterium BICA1-7]|nr:MAG: hypothetical protein JL50_13325 [Peptococcaceae bacterium BICA1-7]HBV99395.1 hypothetical protein [Desulfotomaculum sp.]